MSQFSKVARIKYENQVFNVLDILRFSEVEIVSLSDDYFLVKAKEDYFFVRNTLHPQTAPVWTLVAEFSGKDNYGYNAALIINKDMESKSWYCITLSVNGVDFLLEGERVNLGMLDLY